MGFVFRDAVNESPEKIVLLQNSVTFLHNAVRDKVHISGLIGGEILDFQKCIFERDNPPVTGAQESGLEDLGRVFVG